MRPAEFSKVRMTLQRKGVSSKGVSEFLAGKPVSNSADRFKLAAILVSYEKKHTK